MWCPILLRSIDAIEPIPFHSRKRRKEESIGELPSENMAIDPPSPNLDPPPETPIDHSPLDSENPRHLAASFWMGSEWHWRCQGLSHMLDSNYRWCQPRRPLGFQWSLFQRLYIRPPSCWFSERNRPGWVILTKFRPRQSARRFLWKALVSRREWDPQWVSRSIPGSSESWLATKLAIPPPPPNAT